MEKEMLELISQKTRGSLTIIKNYTNELENLEELDTFWIHLSHLNWTMKILETTKQ